MSQTDAVSSTRALAHAAIAAAARTELLVMEAVDAVVARPAGSPLDVVVDDLERELARRRVSGPSVRGGALLALADEVLLRGRRVAG